MRTLTLAISRSCPNACAFCEVADELDGARVPAPEIKAAIDRAHRADVHRVVFTGGEPLLGRHLVRAIAYAHGLGLRTSVSTAGRLLSDPGIVGRLEAAGLRELSVALHAVDPDVHTRLVGDPAAHPQTLHGLRAVVPSSLQVTIRTVLTAYNRREIRPLIDLAHDLGVQMELRGLEVRGAARRSPDLSLPPEHAHEIVIDALVYAQQRGVPLGAHGFLPHPRLVPAVRTSPPPDETLRPLCRAGIWTAGLRHHLPDAARPWLDPRPEALRAAGLPVPHPALGPLLPAGKPIHILAPLDDDPLATASGLPALAQALRARQVRVTLHPGWGNPSDEDGLPSATAPRTARWLAPLRRDPRPGVPWGSTAEVREASLPHLLHTIQKSDAGAFIVRGMPSARRLRDALPDGPPILALDGDPRQLDPARPIPRLTLLSPLPLSTEDWDLAQAARTTLVAWPPLVDPASLPRTSPGPRWTLLGGSSLDLPLAQDVLSHLNGPVQALGPASGLAPELPDDPRVALSWLATSRALLIPHTERPPPSSTVAWMVRAACLGVPVIATTTRAVDAVFGPGGGVGVPLGDLHGLVAAIQDPPHATDEHRQAALDLASPERLADLLVHGRPTGPVPQGPASPW